MRSPRLALRDEGKSERGAGGESFKEKRTCEEQKLPVEIFNGEFLFQKINFLKNP